MIPYRKVTRKRLELGVRCGLRIDHYLPLHDILSWKIDVVLQEFFVAAYLGHSVG